MIPTMFASNASKLKPRLHLKVGSICVQMSWIANGKLSLNFSKMCWLKTIQKLASIRCYIVLQFKNVAKVDQTHFEFLSSFLNFWNAKFYHKLQHFTTLHRREFLSYNEYKLKNSDLALSIHFLQNLIHLQLCTFNWNWVILIKWFIWGFEANSIVAKF